MRWPWSCGPGRVNADGMVTALDALHLANGINNNQTIDEAPNLDVDNNFAITVADFDLAIEAVHHTLAQLCLRP